MRNWKAIIFDMDGTLFDTETISMKAWKRVGETLQLPTSDEFILSLIGRTRKDQQVVFDSYMSKDWPQEEACSLHTQFKKEEKLKNGVPHGGCNGTSGYREGKRVYDCNGNQCFSGGCGI